METKKPLWFRMIKTCMAVILSIVVIVLFVGFVGVGAAAGLVASLVKDQDIPSKEELARDIQNFSQTSYIYDRNEKRIGSGELRTADDRELVTINEVSPYIIDAFISTEDKEFYEHNGIVPRSILRAAIQDLTGSATTSGGSTITQQLVKLSVLKNPEQTYSRKAREIFLALRLERLFDKEDILTSYLNRIYFGQGASNEHLYGIEAAAEGIFGVTAKDVNLAQAAYLAGIPQRPNGYSPFDEETLASGIERQHTVLRRMLSNGTITEEEFEEAKSFDIAGSLADAKKHTYDQYPYLYEAIHKQTAIALMKADDIDVAELNSDTYRDLLERYKQRASEGGYRIYTTIDMDLYKALNKIVEEYNGYKPDVEVTVEGIDGKITAKEQIGSSLVNTETGELLAFVGGRDKESIKNRALDAKKQVGSSAKPILAYGPGMANGTLQPGTILDDSAKTAKGPGGHTYRNFSRRYYGFVTVREALANSYNVASVDAFRKVGIANGYQFINEMHMPVTPDFQVESGVLGANGFTPEQMAAAYATFGNAGTFNEPYMISRIEDSEGDIVYEHEHNPKEIMSPQSAYLLTDVLRDVLRRGTGTRVGAGIGNYDVAGKTGTAQNAKDVWFVGYTPKISLSVWVGYDYEQSDPIVRPNDKLAQIMWIKFFNTIQATKPDLSPAGTKFKRPGGIVSAQICKISGKRATEQCNAAGHAHNELFQSGKVPKDTCDVHIEARVVEYEGKRYIANDKTPDDMIIDKGVGIRIPDHHRGLNLHYESGDHNIPWERDPRKSEGTPKAPQVTVKNGTVTWQHTGQASVVGYRVYRSTGGDNFNLVASIRLDQEMRYAGEADAEYIVKAVDVVGLESGDSNIAGDIAPNKPSAPSGLTGQFTGNGVNLSWQANPGDEQVMHYLVIMDGKQVAKVNDTKYTHNGSFNGNRTYTIVAVNEGGQSNPSNAVTVEGNPDKPQDPAPPSNSDGSENENDNDDDNNNDDGEANGPTTYLWRHTLLTLWSI